MNKPLKKSRYHQLRTALTVIKILGILGVVFSALDLSAAGVAASLMIAVMSALSEVIVDMAERQVQAQPILDALPILTNIQRALDDLREVQILQSKDPQIVLRYAEHQYGGAGFPAGEAIIASDAQAAFDYASNILAKPFPAGEAAIAKIGPLAFEYACKVLQGPFPAGEMAIRQHEEFQKRYEIRLQDWAVLTNADATN